MTTKQIIDSIRKLLGQHQGSERELYDALCDEAETWKMRLEELEDNGDEESSP